ncbi:signal peptidase II [Bariatricus sp. SGI.154]|uniref:signal peptidase II n=1 Tax=Bariatricus sp. SGI.154 TaxID=3420549 RepID=UPI003CFF023F
MLSWMMGLFAVLLGTDEAIKQQIEENVIQGENRKILGGRIIIRKVYNRGFLLNLLDQHPAVIKGTSVVTGLGVLFYDAMIFMKKGHYVRKLGMTLLSAGAASNIFDRLVRGKVIDYIGVRTENKFLARITANLGDFYIALGALLTSMCNIGK